MKCVSVLIRTLFHLAKLPQRTKVIPSWESDIFCNTLSVNSAHQHFAWLAGFDASTVRIEFKSSTHCFAQFSRFPDTSPLTPLLKGEGSPSFSISLNIFLRLGGILTQSCTEKLNPWACHSQWYGSWPRITTFTSSTGTDLNAANMFFCSG